MSNQLHFGGKPIGPDIRRLEEKFGERGPGDTITYEEISHVLDVDCKSTRFKTVRTAWMKHLFTEKNIASVCLSGQGIRFLPEEERTSDGVKTARQGVRKFHKGQVKVSAVQLEKLKTEEQKMRTLHAQRLLEGIAKGARAKL
jgi:hypothetical protein